MKNYKGYNKRPYCRAHYPTTKFTTVTDTPENLRLAKQQKNQSNIEYWKNRKTTLQAFTTVVDTPENLRLTQQQKNQSELAYRKDKVNALKEFTAVADSVAKKTATNSATLASQVKYQTAPHEVGREGKSIGEIVNRTEKIDIKNEDVAAKQEDAPASESSSQENSQQTDNVVQESKPANEEKIKKRIEETGESVKDIELVSECQDKVEEVALNNEKFVAMFNYKATDDDEISLQEGDVITEGFYVDEGWMEGRNERSGLYGMLPSNYVKRV